MGKFVSSDNLQTAQAHGPKLTVLPLRKTLTGSTVPYVTHLLVGLGSNAMHAPQSIVFAPQARQSLVGAGLPSVKSAAMSICCIAIAS